MNRIYLTVTLLLSAAAASAQYNPTIDVEGKYKPDIIIRDRIGMFPEKLRLDPQKSTLQFDTRGVVTDFLPMAVPMEASGWNDTRAPFPRHGYVQLEAGSWLDARLNAGYRFVTNRSTMAGVYLRYNTTSLWKPKISDLFADVKRNLHDGDLGFYIRHKASTGVFNALVNYNLAYFNYFGFAPEYVGKTIRSDEPTQTFNGVDIRASWSSDKELDFRYHAGADIRYSAMRRGYAALGENFRGSREVWVSPAFGFSYSRNGRSSFGLDLKGDFVSYTGGTSMISAYQICDRPGAYGNLALTPYYRLSTSSVDFTIGPRIDLTFNGRTPEAYFTGLTDGTPSKRASTFHIAPELRFSWHRRGVAVTLEALGGAELNTLASMRDLSIYCQPFVLNTTPTRSPLDAALHLGFGPFAGFSGELTAAYRIVSDRRAGGWFTPFLNGDAQSLATGYMALPGNNVSYDSHGLSLGLGLAYRYGKWLDMSLRGTWQKQDGRNSYWNGWDLPEVTLGAALAINPWRSLRIATDYELRACRHMALMQLDNNAGHTSVSNVTLPNHSSLSATLSYDILPNLQVKAEARNLLNRKQALLPGLPEPGITILGGLAFRF